MKRKYKKIPGMFEVEGEPEVVTDIRASILDKFKDLIFDEGPHIYTLNGEQLPSVTTFIHKYEEEFDTVARSEAYALKHGETPEYWRDKWKWTNLKATTTGTLCHAYGESLGNMLNGNIEGITSDNLCKYVKEKNWLIPTRGKEEAMLNFYKELNPNLHFVLAEAKIFTEGFKQNLAGTADILFYYDDPNGKNSGLCVFDWKTNSDIRKQYSRDVGKMLLPPFDDYYDEPLSVYTLQLNIYSIPFEDMGYNVIAKRVVWVKDDGTYEVVPLANEVDRLREALK